MLTGYPSIDKPWLKYYTPEAINAKVPDCSIYEYLWKCNQFHLGETAIVYFGQRITYGELFSCIDKAASGLIGMGVKAGDIVSVLSLNTPETISIIYALNKIGAVVSMEPVTQTSQLLDASIKETHTRLIAILDMFATKYSAALQNASLQKVLILNSGIPNQSFEYNEKCCSYNEFLLSANEAHNIPAYHSQKNTPAVIIQTSGTTAIPKKVVLTNENVNSVVLQYDVANFQFVRGETFLEIVPPYLSVGFTLQMHTPLCLGLKSIISLDPDPKKVAEMFAAYNPNNFMAGVAHVKEIAKNPLTQNMDLSALRNFAIGGESIPCEERDEINNYLVKHNASIKLITGYGMTELSSSVITEQKNAQNSKSIGIPLSKVVVKVVDVDTGSELSYQETGELLIQSPSMMKEYMGKQKETVDTIEVDAAGERWLHTGDLGYVDENGFVFIVGRIKRIFQTFDPESHQIYKLYPDYIESEISGCPIVERAAVIAVTDELLLQKPIAFIVLKDKSLDAESIIREYLLDRMASYNMPAEFIVIEQIPLLANGKIDYRKLEDSLNCKQRNLPLH